MAIWGALAIPIFVGLAKLLLFRSRIVWWEAFLPLGMCLIVIPITKFCVERAHLSDTEFWGGYATEAWFYEGWDEYIHQTCTRTNSDGETETYDCSYVDRHPPYWELRTTIGDIRIESGGSLGSGFTFPKFEDLAAHWGNRQFEDMGRSYHWTDGDAYYTTWPRDDETLIPVTRPHRYENRVQVASSVFNFPDVLPEEVENFGLHDYPPILDGYKQRNILGNGGPSQPKADARLQQANALLGAPKQVRMYILLYKNQPLEASHKQEGLWKGGNKNELVLTIGLDDQNHVDWARVFSWSDSERLKVDIREYVAKTFKDRPLDLVMVVNHMARHTEEQFVRKEFAEFSYLKVEPPFWGVILAYVLTLLASGGVTAWTLLNDLRKGDAELRGAFRRRRF